MTSVPAATNEETNLDQEKKEKVLGAAQELFSRYGFKKTTVDEIADAAGMSKRTVYEVLKSKEAILAELVMSEALSFRKHLTGKMKTLGDPVEKFRLFCELSTLYFDENPFLGQVLFDQEALYEPFLGSEIHVIEEGMQDIIANLLREGVRKGAYREMDVKGNAQCIFVLFRGFTYRRGDLQGGNKEWVRFILRAITAE
jgi:AcrR family transcriptional regulator